MLGPMGPAEATASAAEGRLRAAALLDDGSGQAARLLAEAARQQHAAGRRLRGMLMTRDPQGERCSADMWLVDIERGDQYLVSQPLGRDSTACRADPQGFARASVVLRRALADRPDLIVLNRFGALEAEGEGFRAELLEILAHDVPLLTAVKPRHLAAWQDFTGGAAVLPAEARAVQQWLADTLGP